MKRRQNSFITAKRKVFRIRLIALLLLVVWNSLLVNRLRTVRQITTKKVLDKQILSELQYFPLAFQNEHRETTWKAEAVICNYEDSWQSARTFGGARKHEGTDLMTIRNERGIYPIVSMTDGTLEQMGWLKLGGWRIGIRSASGTYITTHIWNPMRRIWKMVWRCMPGSFLDLQEIPDMEQKVQPGSLPCICT